VIRLPLAMMKATTIALALGILFMVYLLLNASASLDDSRQSQKSLREEQRLLESILLKTATASNLSRATIVQLIKDNFSKDHIVKMEDGQILIDGVVLRFDNDALIDVCSLEDAASTSCAQHQQD
jgi:hypothetical protein